MRISTVFILLFLLATAPAAKAQTLRINNQCNPLVASLENIVYVVRQDYALKGPDDVLYGQNDQAFFGFRYGGALIWNGHLYMSPITYYAYLKDTSAKSYGAEYVPVPTVTSFKHLQADAFTVVDAAALKATPEKASVVMADSLSGKQPVEMLPGSTKKTILVTFENRDPQLSDTSKYRLNFLYTDLIREPNGKMHLKETNLSNAVRFALVFDEVTEVGVARLEFRGFAEMVNGEVQVNLIKVDEVPETNDKGKSKRK